MSEFDRFIREGDEPVDEFVRECEEMMTVKFILAERKISELLITIATSKKLSDVVAACSRGFDFYDALSASRIKAGKRWSLLPPVRMREQIAFAVNLLYAFDVRAIPLQEFLEEFYHSANGINFSTQLFARGVIAPLKDNVLAYLAGGGEEQAPPKPTARSFSEAGEREDAALPDEAVRDITERLADICDIAEADGLMTDPELKELYSVAGGMAESVKRRDAQLIRTSMTGLTAVIRGGCMAERLSEKTAELDETLRHFGI